MSCPELRAQLAGCVLGPLLLCGAGADLPRDPVMANEESAVHSLRSIAAAQSSLQASGAIDGDADGVGEFGWLGELSGAVPLRGSPRLGLLDPPLLAEEFQEVRMDGSVRSSGYRFLLFLPGMAGQPIREGEHRWPPGPVGSDQAEQYWICYAWPEEFGVTGRRAFVVSQFGHVLETNNLNAGSGNYSGDIQPTGDSALVGSGDLSTSLSIGGIPNSATDGNTWYFHYDGHGLQLFVHPYLDGSDFEFTLRVFGGLVGTDAAVFLVALDGNSIDPVLLYVAETWRPQPYQPAYAYAHERHLDESLVGTTLTLRAYAETSPGIVEASHDVTFTVLDRD